MGQKPEKAQEVTLAVSVVMPMIDTILTYATVIIMMTLLHPLLNAQLISTLRRMLMLRLFVSGFVVRLDVDPDDYQHLLAAIKHLPLLLQLKFAFLVPRRQPSRCLA